MRARSKLLGSHVNNRSCHVSFSSHIVASFKREKMRFVKNHLSLSISALKSIVIVSQGWCSTTMGLAPNQRMYVRSFGHQKKQ